MSRVQDRRRSARLGAGSIWKIPQVAALSAALVTLAATLSASAVTLTPVPVPVRARLGINERMPAADGAWISWAQTSRRVPTGYNVFAKKGSGPRIRISIRSTAEDDGWSYGPNGGGIDGRRLVYMELGKRWTHDIYKFDLVTHKRTKFPKKVNTAAVEFHPTVSGNWLLFTRDHSGFRSKVLLYNIKTHGLRVLDRTGWEDGWFLWSGQVNGRYATWQRQGAETSDVYLYDIRTKTTTRIPRPAEFANQGGPSVAKDGTVYYVRSGQQCVSRAELARYRLGGPAETLYTFPRGKDIGLSFVDESTSVRDIYLEAAECNRAETRQWDVLRMRDHY